jgi:hypothetical protein
MFDGIPSTFIMLVGFAALGILALWALLILAIHAYKSVYLAAIQASNDVHNVERRRPELETP